MQKFWDYQSRSPDAYFTSQFGAQIAGAVLDFIPRHARILDYACGTGALTGHLLRAGLSVAACDLSRDSVEIVQGKYQKHQKQPGFLGAFSIAELALASFLSLAMCISHFVLYVGRGSNSFVWGPVALLVVLFAVVAILARTRKGISVKRLDQLLGDLSYPVYLNHYAVTVVMLSLFPVGSENLFLLCIFLCLVASWAVAQLTEPFTKGLRNRVRGVVLR